MAKKAKAKKAVRAKTNGNGLGGEGTIGYVARKAIVDGADNAAVLKLLVKKFPKAKIGKGYPSWYRADSKRKGLISARA